MLLSVLVINVCYSFKSCSAFNILPALWLRACRQMSFAQCKLSCKTVLIKLCCGACSIWLPIISLQCGETFPFPDHSAELHTCHYALDTVDRLIGGPVEELDSISDCLQSDMVNNRGCTVTCPDFTSIHADYNVSLYSSRLSLSLSTPE